MRTVAIIPARGGSQGIPKKNLQRVSNRTLIERAVTTATEAAHVDGVFVSTDDPEIGSEATRTGAEVIRRPNSISGNTASSESAVRHALKELQKRGIAPLVTALLQCTSPFTRPGDVDAVISAVDVDGFDAAFTAARFHGFVWRASPTGYQGVNHDQSAPRQRRQDRPPEMLETGAAYAFRTDGFLAAKSRFFGRIHAIEVDPRRALEIDEGHDLEVANLLAASLDESAHQPDLAVREDEPRTMRLRRTPRMVALDFDGVFTDNRVLTSEDGTEAVFCHRGDGHGLAQLQRLVPVIVLSTEENPVVAARCRKLGLPYIQGLGEGKLAALERYAQQHEILLEDVLFVGNDTNDLDCMRAVGTAVTVADGVPEVLSVCHLVLSRRGGDGALRELCDILVPLYASH